MATSELGDYLRGRRAAMGPDAVGLPVSRHRRVAGLRREEVALLAGLSVDYYSRLEQGRERSPSAQVVDSLADALRLDTDGRRHLYRLAGYIPSDTGAVDDRVDPALLQLMSAWPDNPAIVFNIAYDVLASNGIADVLFHKWTHSRNLMQIVFTDPHARTFYCDWQKVARNSVAGFRLNHGRSPGHPRIQRVLEGLLATSPEFTELWERHDARGKTREQKLFHHDDVGELTLSMQTFDVRSSPGQELVVYQAEPGSSSADALKLLGSLAETVGTANHGQAGQR
ncbi:helix-turn-helix domain-containing protein [Mycolicibacterium wolinskyi]|uniref:XRE family transcriptional regulator n=1 Tax=Mycolicibacterium wolinskyi TaxID=59750 RepID=A0A1X2F231_9MYCO|nr:MULTISPECIES: helix-turn-helix transcriptional regulator [Mycolicibacterium]MCV7287751.1 helix-turn-helix domain-containing protein [Mycolicibacterium wolinskyi]MCV7294649.1 helix-turn-helix domain-containing protein [Mycolicibacterium goodii]ORX12482.1 XRE family transcriptional regulator [Mycolicibacterium wolinskyi]